MNYRTHLFLKNPDGKQPFIGVGYEAGNDFGGTGNTDVFKYDKIASLLIWRESTHIDITVVLRGHYHTFNYRDISFNPAALSEWLRACKDSKTIYFGHVQKSESGYVVFKEGLKYKPCFLEVDRIIVINSYNKIIHENIANLY